MQANLSCPQAAMRVATLQLLCTSTDVPSTEDDDNGPALPGPPQLPGSEPESGGYLSLPASSAARIAQMPSGTEQGSSSDGVWPQWGPDVFSCAWPGSMDWAGLMRTKACMLRYSQCWGGTY